MDKAQKYNKKITGEEINIDRLFMYLTVFKLFLSIL